MKTVRFSPHCLSDPRRAGLWFFLAFLGLVSVLPAIDGEVSDGLPFFLEKERGPVDEAFARIADEPDAAAQPVGFIPLSRQSRAYRMTLVHIEGRLLRVNEVALPAEKEDGLNIETYYESWVLLDDERQIPIRLITHTLPSETAPSQAGDPLRKERISADGIYYRLASYNAGDDFYTSPVVIAESFCLLSRSAGGGEGTRSVSPWRWKGVALALLLAVWIFLRFVMIPRRRRAAARRRTDRDMGEPPFDPAELDSLRLPDSDKSDEAEPGSDDPSGRIPPSFPGKIAPLVLLALSAAVNAPAQQDDLPPLSIDRFFWEEISPVDPDSLFASQSEESEIFNESLQIILTRLQSGISPGLLARALMPGEEVFGRLPEKFGAPIRFGGEVTAITRKRLEERADFTPLDAWRIELGKNDPPLTVWTASIPKGWGEDGAAGEGQKCGGIGIFFESYTEPILAAGQVGWVDAPGPLGSLGLDVSLFDGIEAHAIGELASLPAGEARQKMLRNFRLTPGDRYPFYGLLAGAAHSAGKTVPAEPDPPTAVDLFNRPAESQGKLVTLTGHLRRTQRVLVPDEEITALYGIDHYYELYLFTADSQDYPILFCTPELPASPDGRLLPVGSGNGYREEVTLTGFLYKPWAYRIDPANSGFEPGFLDSDKSEGKSWIAVPLMIGLRGIWNPEASGGNANPFSPKVYPVLGGFLFLVILYTLLRRRSKPLRFRVGGAENPEGPF